MSTWKPEFLCVLDPGCNRGGHSLHCQDENKKYAEKQRLAEQRRRMAAMTGGTR